MFIYITSHSKKGRNCIMLTRKEFIDSGILEQYILGACSDEETKEVLQMLELYPEVKEEMEAIELSLEAYSLQNTIEPNPIVKPFLMATIDYSERLQNGEPVSNPPILHAQSTIEDYSPWLNRTDMVKSDTDDVFAKIIGYTPQAITAIVWLKDYAPQEVHDDEHEKFLIIEGSCDIIVGNEINQLIVGDYFAIPLHKNHIIKVTSSQPCKVILQRVAA